MHSRGRCFSFRSLPIGWQGLKCKASILIERKGALGRLGLLWSLCGGMAQGEEVGREERGWAQGARWRGRGKGLGGASGGWWLLEGEVWWVETKRGRSSRSSFTLL